MIQHTRLCLSIAFGALLLTGCSGTTMPVLYGDQQLSNGQRMLVPLASATTQTSVGRDSLAMNSQEGIPSSAQRILSIVPEAVPFLSPAPLTLSSSSDGTIEIRSDGAAAHASAGTLVDAQLFSHMSPAVQALLFPSCSSERLPTFLSASR